MATPSRAAARRVLLRRLIGRGTIRSQEELVERLARNGHRVTQTTVSRDLAALGVQKTPLPDGGEAYSLEAEVRGNGRRPHDTHLARMLREFVTGIEHSGNLVVVKTPPGAAQPVASALDAAPPRGVLGTVAGDDTILIVTTATPGSFCVARNLEQMMEARTR